MIQLLTTLTEVIKLQAERDKAFADCDGTWGYFGHDIEEQLAQAKDAFHEALSTVIDQRIEAAK